MIASTSTVGRCRLALFASAALAVGVSSLAHAEVAAATADDSSAIGLEEVVVTAQKRETKLQDTPISISTLNGDDLVNRHAQSVEDLIDGSIPSLRVAPFFARSSALTIGMRGIGALGDANQPARDQAVGVYIDGVYLGRAQGLGSALYDVARIEVLKGPQGTLFGRNTEGGAISIVTRQPSGVFKVNATAGYGNYSAYKAEAHVDLPTFNKISLKFDGLLSKRDGTTHNPITSGEPDFNSYDKRGFHAEALWKPLDNFSADYAFDISYDGTTPYYVQLLGPGALARAPLIRLQPDRAHSANVGVPIQLSKGNTYGHRLTLDWNLTPDIEIKSVSSYRRLSQSQYDNAEENLSVFSPNGFFSRYSIAHTYQDQYSEELQAVGRVPNIEFAAGAFYFHEAARDNAQTPNSLQWNATGTGYTLVTLNLDKVSLDRASHVTTESSGVFGQATWTPPVLDGITHLTLGGRFTHDKKNGSLDTVNGAVPSYVDASKVTITGPVPLAKSWNRFDPLVILAVDATPDINLYGKWSTGYKSGGANSRSLTYRAFNPETVSMFEAGAKTEFWDHRARFNVAAYTGRLKDVQVDFSVIILNNNRGTLETTNAATGRTKGVEADFALQPLEGLTLSGSYTYTKVRLSKAFNPFTNLQATVNPLYTPRNAGSLAADYQQPVAIGTLRAHIDVNMADGQYTSTTDPNVSDKSVLVNGRLAVSDIRMADSGASLQLSVWARNLFNEQHAFLRNFNAALGTYGIFNEPRTFGVEGNVRF
ncbi:TonB-dependent receptor [Phenylobacterium sp.]|uniref:TonB-dependent receptor n=1 Tax=Phenylobacterium sp. TaxID=1871053 RepID=UPI0025E4EBC2|nr:TonB-dependent receptor [Phenylobacterium sp.]